MLVAHFINCIRKVWSDLNLLRKGQKPYFDLLQLSHRLEKGLLIKNPKPMWGWDKAFSIAALLKSCEEDFSTITANAVLSAYLDAKSKSEFKEDRERYNEFIRSTGFQSVAFEGLGGTQKIQAPLFTSQEQLLFHRLFDTRHSCRVFAERHVLNKDLKEAVKMALRCPSACNRQPFHVYAINPIKLAEKLGRNRLQYSGDRTLIVTGDVRAFNTNELLDWIVSPSIFAGYLTLSLHSLGIGSCVVRKDLVKDNTYTQAVRAITGMDESEQIVLEMFIGYYKDEFEVPCSNRAQSENIITFV